MNLDARISKLEQENRRLKLAGLLSGLLAVVAFSAGAHWQDAPAENVRAKRFELVDGDGNVRVIIGKFSAESEVSALGIALQNKEGVKLTDWTVSTKTADVTIYSPDGKNVAQFGSNSSTQNGIISGELKIRNLEQDSTVRIGQTFNVSGLFMEQTTMPGAGRQVIALSHSKNQSASLVLGNGIEIERAILSAPADKPCRLQLGDYVNLLGGPNPMPQ